MHRGNRQEQANIYTAEQIRRVISNSGINIASEVDSDYLIFCPYHNNYRTPAAEISKNHGTFFCFACHESRSLTEFVMHVTNKTYFEAVRFIESFKDGDNIVDIVDKILDQEPEFKPFDELMIKRLHQAVSNPRPTWYFESRRINTSSMTKFYLGYSEKQDMVTVPMQTPDGSMFVGFVARSIEGKDFKNTPGLPKSKILFNLHRAKKFDTVYVVESTFDAIRLDQNGIPAVATLGSNVSRSQIDMLKKYFNNIVVIGDNDDAGKSMQNNILDKVGKRATLISIPKRFKDVGDMTDADIQELTTRINDPLLAMY